MSSIVIPESAFIGIVVAAGKLSLRSLPRALPNASFEMQVGGKHFSAHGDAARHQGFKNLCQEIRDTLEGEATPAAPVKAAKPEWCHYHKANVGHSMDHCPAVTCRKCHKQGHTDRVCTAEPCGECGNFGHASDDCFSKMKCEKCGVVGHPTERCYAKPKRPVWCHYHEVEGDHHSSECPDLKDWQCENCGEKGHFFRNCRHPNIVRRPRERAEVTEREKQEYIFANGNAAPLRSRPKPRAQQ